MTALATPKSKKQNKHKTNHIKSKIKEQILNTLGKPHDLWRIDVHLYRHGQARVNIWRTIKIKPESLGGLMGAMGQSSLVERTIITDSYYLHLSRTAVIKDANPPIGQKYQVSKQETASPMNNW